MLDFLVLSDVSMLVCTYSHRAVDGVLILTKGNLIDAVLYTICVES